MCNKSERGKSWKKPSCSGGAVPGSRKAQAAVVSTLCDDIEATPKIERRSTIAREAQQGLAETVRLLTLKNINN